VQGSLPPLGVPSLLGASALSEGSAILGGSFAQHSAGAQGPFSRSPLMRSMRSAVELRGAPPGLVPCSSPWVAPATPVLLTVCPPSSLLLPSSLSLSLPPVPASALCPCFSSLPLPLSPESLRLGKYFWRSRALCPRGPSLRLASQSRLEWEEELLELPLKAEGACCPRGRCPCPLPLPLPLALPLPLPLPQALCASPCPAAPPPKTPSLLSFPSAPRGFPGRPTPSFTLQLV